MAKTLADLTADQFEEMLDSMSNPEHDALTGDEFFNILAEMDAPDEIHLTGHLENGQLVFDEPAALPVNGNVIQVGAKRIVVELRSTA